MAIKNEYLKRVFESVQARDKNEPEFLQTVEEVFESLEPVMEKHPELKLQLVGHTSPEGDPVKNQILSEARAQAAVDFLIARGIATERLEAIGKGSSELIDNQNLEVNRRTEFIVID